MKTLEFLYQETAIHFLVNPLEKNVMVNATEMAKLFGKRLDVFLKAKHTQNFISFLQKENAELPPNGGSSVNEIITTNFKNGTYMNEVLALKFAAWLDVEFEVWVYKRIQEVIFGNYKKHWDAHARQEEAKIQMQQLKKELLTAPSTEIATAYFEQESLMKSATKAKTKAIRQQLRLFNN